MSEDEMNQLTDALRTLRPTAAPLDRDRLLYEAGRAGRPTPWLWPAATAVSSLAAVILAVMLCLRPAPAVVIHYVQVPVPQQAPPGPAPLPPLQAEAPPVYTSPEPDWPTSRHQQLQDQLLRWGLDGMAPAPPSPPAPTPQALERLEKSF